MCEYEVYSIRGHKAKREGHFLERPSQHTEEAR